MRKPYMFKLMGEEVGGIICVQGDGRGAISHVQCDGSRVRGVSHVQGDGRGGDVSHVQSDEH